MLPRTPLAADAQNAFEHSVDGISVSAQVSISQPTNSSTAQALADGNWHMFTLTTLAPRTKGYSIFLDGQLAGAMLPNETYWGAVLHKRSCTLCTMMTIGCLQNQTGVVRGGDGAAPVFDRQHAGAMLPKEM